MTASEAIADLDSNLADYGQSISFRKSDGSETLVTTGFVRGYQPQQLVGLIQEVDRNVILSPTGVGAFVIEATDQVALNGQLGTVQSVEPVSIGATVVRLNCRVRFS